METGKTFTIDATNQPLGRLATRIARILTGKHDVAGRPHLVTTDRVLVKNVAQVRIHKKKLTQKLYYRTSMYPGGLKTETLGIAFAKSPEDVLRRTVKGMLPKNKLQDRRLKQLDVE